MKLKSLVVDGFKSYAHRQELADLDPHFNAITGLNGSGKSNLFDALCFVMGISNMKKVRVEDNRELIFKSGNAGIQRASVTIEFSNDDPRTAPDGYPCAEFPVITISRQIMTGGRQKYFFNGRVTELGRIKQFFHGVSLNVDNPHFLVLQGTVHKLVGMKSSEILGWLEEAAGTRVFDARRRTAELLIAGKNKKLEEIGRTIDGEIGPTLRAMRAEQDEFAKFQLALQSLEELRKFKVAHTYWMATSRTQETEHKIAQLRQAIHTADGTRRALVHQRNSLQQNCTMLEEAVLIPSSNASRLREESGHLKTQAAATRAKLAAADRSLKQAETALKKIDSEKTRDAAALEQLLASTQSERAAHNDLTTALEAETAQLARLKESLQLLASGVQVGVGGKSLQQELDEATRAEIQCKGLIDRKRHKIDALTKLIEQSRAEARNDDRTAAKLATELERAQKELLRSEHAFAPFASFFDEQQRLRTAVGDKRMQLRRMTTEAMGAQAGSSTLPRLTYDPVPGFDFATAIKGRLGELVTVRDPEAHGLALSVGAAATNLFKVVISDDRTVQALIERGNLRQRTGFFVLNKMAPGGGIDHMRLAAAAALARERGGWVGLASELIDVDPAYRAVADKVFGTFVVCSDIELAKAIAFNPQARCRAVTFDGDSADPSGIMAGGSSSSLRNFLKEFAASRNVNAPLERLEGEIRQLEQEARALDARNAEVVSLRAAVDQAKMRVEDIRRQRENLPGAAAERLADESEKEVLQLREELAGLEPELRRLADLIREHTAALQQNDVRGMEADLKAKIKASMAKEKELKERLFKARSAADSFETRKAELEARISDAASEMQERRTERDAMASEQEKVAHAAQQAELLVNQNAADLDFSTREMERIAKELDETREQLKALVAQDDQLAKTMKDNEAEAKAEERFLLEAKKTAREIEQRHEFLARVDRSTLGDPNGPFYFLDGDRTAAALAELVQAEAASDAMGRKVNRRAGVVYDQCKKEYDDLMTQREALTTDRGMILETIQQVEDRKWAALDNMVDKVSQSFSSLFGMCLPQAAARLVEERDPATRRLVGLQVKVAFNGKEKDSLSELSGGQRSLLALCLILAILRFRPAPFYVLDEVDAALDPSHTQAIGKMLKAHFADAQFLLVSLKDGMYSSANVIYEVRNNQGYSEVSRRAPR